MAPRKVTAEQLNGIRQLFETFTVELQAALQTSVANTLTAVLQEKHIQREASGDIHQRLSATPHADNVFFGDDADEGVDALKEIIGDPIFDVYDDEVLIQFEDVVEDLQLEEHVQQSVYEIGLHVVEDVQLEATKDAHIINKVDERSCHLLEALETESYERINEIDMMDDKRNLMTSSNLGSRRQLINSDPPDRGRANFFFANHHREANREPLNHVVSTIILNLGCGCHSKGVLRVLCQDGRAQEECEEPPDPDQKGCGHRGMMMVHDLVITLSPSVLISVSLYRTIVNTSLRYSLLFYCWSSFYHDFLCVLVDDNNACRHGRREHNMNWLLPWLRSCLLIPWQGEKDIINFCTDEISFAAFDEKWSLIKCDAFCVSSFLHGARCVELSMWVVRTLCGPQWNMNYILATKKCGSNVSCAASKELFHHVHEASPHSHSIISAPPSFTCFYLVLWAIARSVNVKLSFGAVMTTPTSRQGQFLDFGYHKNLPSTIIKYMFGVQWAIFSQELVFYLFLPLDQFEVKLGEVHSSLCFLGSSPPLMSDESYSLSCVIDRRENSMFLCPPWKMNVTVFLQLMIKIGRWTLLSLSTFKLTFIYRDYLSNVKCQIMMKWDAFSSYMEFEENSSPSLSILQLTVHMLELQWGVLGGRLSVLLAQFKLFVFPKAINGRRSKFISPALVAVISLTISITQHKLDSICASRDAFTLVMECLGVSHCSTKTFAHCLHRSRLPNCHNNTSCCHEFHMILLQIFSNEVRLFVLVSTFLIELHCRDFGWGIRDVCDDTQLNGCHTSEETFCYSSVTFKSNTTNILDTWDPHLAKEQYSFLVMGCVLHTVTVAFVSLPQSELRSYYMDNRPFTSLVHLDTLSHYVVCIMQLALHIGFDQSTQVHIVVSCTPRDQCNLCPHQDAFSAVGTSHFCSTVCYDWGHVARDVYPYMWIQERVLSAFHRKIPLVEGVRVTQGSSSLNVSTTFCLKNGYVEWRAAITRTILEMFVYGEVLYSGVSKQRIRGVYFNQLKSNSHLTLLKAGKIGPLEVLEQVNDNDYRVLLPVDVRIRCFHCQTFVSSEDNNEDSRTNLFLPRVT